MQNIQGQHNALGTVGGVTSRFAIGLSAGLAGIALAFFAASRMAPPESPEAIAQRQAQLQKCEKSLPAVAAREGFTVVRPGAMSLNKDGSCFFKNLRSSSITFVPE